MIPVPIPVAAHGWPDASWTVAVQSDGTIALRIVERRHVTGMLDLHPDAARELAAALIKCADAATSEVSAP